MSNHNHNDKTEQECTCICIDCIEGNHCGGFGELPDGTISRCDYPPSFCGVCGMSVETCRCDDDWDDDDEPLRL